MEMTLRPETQTEAKRKVVTPPRTLAGMARKTPLILARTPYKITVEKTSQHFYASIDGGGSYSRRRKSSQRYDWHSE